MDALLKASPKPNGNTATMANQFARELAATGRTAMAESNLNDLTIRPCQACDACLKPPYSGCVLDDDFMTTFPVFRKADVIVFAAPSTSGM